MPTTAESQVTLAHYQAATHHWAHAEQIRWTLLYNYLMASTILLLAWATIFASQDSAPSKHHILLALAASGGALSALWVALGARATSFVRIYAASGEAIEGTFAAPAAYDSRILAPFAAAARHRTTATGVASLVPSHLVLWAVPQLFLLLYLGLAYVSAGGVLAPGRQVSSWSTVVVLLLYLAFAIISFSRLSHRGTASYNQLIVGAGALIEQDRRILLIKRSHPPFAGLWGLPGGHVGASEDPERAAIREVQEEIGLTVTSRGLVGAYFFDDHPRGAGVFLVYRCERADQGPTVIGSEASEARYFLARDAPEDLAGGGHRGAIRAWLERSSPDA